MSPSKPGSKNPKPAKPSTLTLLYPQWPLRDRTAFETATRRGDVLEPGGPAEHWSDATLQTNIGRYGRWLRFRERSGALEPGMSPADRATPEAVAAYLEALNGTAAPFTVHAYLRGLLNVMLKIAPERDWAWLRVVVENMRKVARPSRDKRLQIRHTRDLYEYGKRLMDEADQPTTGTSLQRAVRFRDGLMTAIFAARAPQRGSLARMEIERQLQKHGDRYWLLFDHTDTKQKREAEDILPVDLTAYIDRYLTVHRAVLLARAKIARHEPAVWLSEKGERLGAPAIRHQIMSRTKAEFDIGIPPHRFRDCLATTIAYDLPAHVGMAAPMLHHAGLSTVERHYNQAARHLAFGKFHENLAAMRQEYADLDLAEEEAVASPRGKSLV